MSFEKTSFILEFNRCGIFDNSLQIVFRYDINGENLKIESLNNEIKT